MAPGALSRLSSFAARLRFVAIALALHAFAFWVAGRSSPAARTVAASEDRRLETPDEVDLLDERTTSAVPAPASPDEPLARMSVATRARASASDIRTARAEDGSSEGPFEPRVEALDRPFDPTVPQSLSPEAIGLGGRNVFLGGLPPGVTGSATTEPGAVVARAAPPREMGASGPSRALQDGLREALHDRDVAQGLGVGGPVVTAAEASVRESDVPLNAHAILEATADAQGDVITVRILGESAGRADWEDVASRVREALRGRKLRVPSGSGGVVVMLDVTSRWQLASGHDPDVEVAVAGQPVKPARPESKNPVRVDVLKPELKVEETEPPPDLNPPVKLPPQHVKAEVKILGVDFDVTDLAPRPSRVVHARIVREKLL
jgi:hypothetical protein